VARNTGWSHTKTSEIVATHYLLECRRTPGRFGSCRKVGADNGQKKGHPKAAHNSQANYNDNSAHSQRMRLLKKLRQSNVTTIEARRDLDILMPAARVFELRTIGHDIATVWTSAPTDCGRTHRIARYVLSREAGRE
jgi:hypothetical protein